jgi:adenine-specific DNA-methyltransferase
MNKLSPKTDGASLDIVEQNIAKLKKIFPDAFTEGKIEFDALREILGDYIDDREERYSFTWNGKSRARQLAQTPSTGTLRPCPEESVNWDTTQNLFIEGDNLEVLKLLQKSYHKKVKMIYIDPPYNTGKEYVYPDKYQDNLETYLRYTGQMDEQGFKLSANAEASGRYHTNWLNMMYPRLKLARNLLRGDGVIFISIDDHELHNLHRRCGEIFGEENILGIIANVNNPKGRSDDSFIATAHEYILVVAKAKAEARLYGFEPDEVVVRRYNKVDAYGKRYRDIDLRKTGDEDRREDRPDMFYYFYFDESKHSLRASREPNRLSSEIEIIPLRNDGQYGRWRWGFDTACNNLKLLHAKYMPVRGIWGIFEIDYLDGRPPVKPTSVWTFKDVNSERGSEQFIQLGFTKEVFPRPKPVGTIRRILEIGTLPKEPSIVLDFFAGSCTTAHAIHSLTSREKRTLRYVLVQLPEHLDPTNKEQKAGHDFCIEYGIPPTIAEIGKERIRSVIKNIQAQQAEKAKESKGKLPGMADTISNLDLGFKVFKLDSSNIKPWDAGFDNLEESLLDAIENIKSDRTEADVLYELLLKYGLDLAIPIEERKIADKTIYIVGAGALVVCLADQIGLDVIEGIAAIKEEFTPEVMRIVFRDASFEDDVVKINAVQILQQAGIDDIKSL